MNYSAKITALTSITPFLFDDASFQFHNVRQGNVIFSRQKLRNIHKCFYYSQIFGGISFDVMAENLETSEGYSYLFAVFLCARIEIDSC